MLPKHFLTIISLFFLNNIISSQNTKLAKDYYSRGRDEFFLGTLDSYEKSAEWYKKAIEIDSNNAIVISGLAETYALWAQQKKNEEEDYSSLLKKSLSYAKKALELDPNLSESHRSLGIVYNIYKNYDAIDELKKAIELNPTDGEAYFWLWLSLEKETTSENIKKALKYSPYYPQIYSNLGIQHAISKNFKKARSYFKKVMKLCPNNPYAYYNIATTYRDEGNLDSAIFYYKKSIELYPTYINAFSVLSMIYFYQNNYDESIKYFEEIIRIRPSCKMSKKINEMVPLYEKYLIDEIKNKKINPKFFISEIQSEGISGSLTLKGTGLSSIISMKMEFPNDAIPVSMGSMSMGRSIPFGENSIHRFIGTIEIYGYTFHSEGSKLNRLTFAVLQDIGYTYIRGKGKVVMKDGKEITFGYSEEDKDNLKKFIYLIHNY